MKKRAYLFWVATLIIPFMITSLMAADRDKTEGVMKKAVVKITETLQTPVGVLEPGNYRVTWIQNGSEHEMIFVRLTRRNGRPVFGPHRIELRIPCKVEPANEKIRATFIQTHRDDDGTVSLARIGLQGESVEHVFETS